MLNCHQVSRLVSERLDHKLTLWQRMNLWMHLAMCKLCSGFSRDMQHLHEAARRQAAELERDSAASGVALSPEARQRIKLALQRRN